MRHPVSAISTKYSFFPFFQLTKNQRIRRNPQPLRPHSTWRRHSSPPCCAPLLLRSYVFQTIMQSPLMEQRCTRSPTRFVLTQQFRLVLFFERDGGRLKNQEGWTLVILDDNAVSLDGTAVYESKHFIMSTEFDENLSQ